jgi:prepilin-type N-terminal cleavage/methylation domain-containing protein/prepilin-type processing-associated H-X9-DG protein
MNRNNRMAKGFTLLEMLVVVAIIALLAALLLPGLNRSKNRARQAACLNNLRQINLAVHMYADDSSDAFPPSTNQPPASFTAYTQLLKNYVGLTGASPQRAGLFACPADTFYYQMDRDYTWQSMHSQSLYYYSSYGFNGGNFVTRPPTPRWPGIAGRKLTSIVHPVRTVLVMELPALLPYSWHEPTGKAHSNNAKAMVSFVDGHVRFTQMYWDATTPKYQIEAWQYDPPAGYDYQWSGD